ncbi:hypothetical protein [Nocardioides limicola]|uniref:hypothetical protein n=1 Tax=Nocardioides limicola TaxID=2803368 RepID=UPI00193C48E5|nr:hypothetical protein [Nocardioides sp. DJM-14]
MYTFGDVRRWDAAPLGAAGEGLKSALDTLEASKDDVETLAVPEGWTGFSSMFAKTRQAVLVAQMESRVAAGRTLVRGLFEAETSITALRRDVEAADGQARANGFRIGDDGSVTSTVTPPTFESSFEAMEWTRERARLAGQIAFEVESIMLTAVAIDSALLATIPFRDDNVSEYGQGSPDVEYAWSKLSDEEKMAVITQIIEELAEELGLDMPTINFDPTMTGNGYWSQGRFEVGINPNNMETTRILHTVAHEMRHGQQYDAVNDLDRGFWDWLRGHQPFDRHEEAGISRGQAEIWRDNFDNYISSGTDFQGYLDQPVEVDAREAGRDYLNNLTVDELDRLLQETR